MGLGIKTKLNNFFEEEVFSYFGPKMIRINPIGFACTNACPMCWRLMKKISDRGGMRKSELKYEKYKQILNDLPFTVSKIEIVGGGEPLLFPRICELIRDIKEKKFFGSLITNGVVMNKKIASSLIDKKWNLVRISINSGTKEVYSVVNGANYFDKVVQNIENLIKNRGIDNFPKIGLHFVLQKTNYFDLSNFFNLAETLKVDFINLDTLIHDSKKELLLSNKEIKTVIKNLKKLKQTFTLEHNIDEAISKLKTNGSIRNKNYFLNKYCQIVQSSIDVDSEGNVVPCCMAYGEKISKKIANSSISKIWKSNWSFRRRLKQGKFEAFCYKKCNYSLNER